MIVLDTHAWLWWASDPARLSTRGRTAIEEASSVGISPLSCWEVTMLAARERIRLDRPVRSWIRQALGLEGVRVLDLTPLAAVAAGELPEDFPGDPVDRLLYATAVELRAPLLTKDRRLRAFDGQVCRW